MNLLPKDTDFALRKNKFVDRRVFIDLLARLRHLKPLEEYVYVGMGGPTLEDHRAIHAYLGMNMLLSFDEEPEVIGRQRINSPTKDAKYITAKSKEVIDQLDSILRDQGFPAGVGKIVWLDYMKPGQLGHQLQEFRGLLASLDEGDVVRITLNADVASLGLAKNERSLEEARLQRLKSRLGEFCPADVSEADVVSDRLPIVIAKAIGKVARDAYPANAGSARFLPLSVVRYADGLQMLTATGIVISEEKVDTFLDKTGMRNWDFWSSAWDAIHHVSVPYLTVRERALLEHEICFGIEPSQSSLRELFEDINAAVRDYVRFKRYFPTFQHVWP